MPIGKNSIKRAVNNGYSNVKTSAPDMENSDVIPTPVEVAQKVATETTKNATKTPVKKTACKKTAKPAQEQPKTQTKKAPTKKSVKNEQIKKFAVGESLPFYLL